MRIMKTIYLTLLALAAQLSASEEAAPTTKSKRGSLGLHYPLELGYSDDLVVSQSGWTAPGLPHQTAEIYAPGVDKYLPFQTINTADYNLKVELPAPPLPSTNYRLVATNSIDKPVREVQEIVLPQSIGTAIIPQMPPPATPVNAVASNVPANTGAVFLGSGSLGVVDLGNGAYALGSGSIGYSGNRAQPRPGSNVPVYPPLLASPNLIPAAVPSPAPFRPIGLPVGNSIDFNHGATPRIDANGYEYLPPNRVGFGAPLARPPRLRTTQQFATPTVLLLQPQYLQPQVPGFGAGYDFTAPPRRPTVNRLSYG